jgi:hypothetical protein
MWFDREVTVENFYHYRRSSFLPKLLEQMSNYRGMHNLLETIHILLSFYNIYYENSNFDDLKTQY